MSDITQPCVHTLSTELPSSLGGWGGGQLPSRAACATIAAKAQLCLSCVRSVSGTIRPCSTSQQTPVNQLHHVGLSARDKLPQGHVSQLCAFAERLCFMQIPTYTRTLHDAQRSLPALQVCRWTRASARMMHMQLQVAQHFLTGRQRDEQPQQLEHVWEPGQPGIILGFSLN